MSIETCNIVISSIEHRLEFIIFNQAGLYICYEYEAGSQQRCHSASEVPSSVQKLITKRVNAVVQSRKHHVLYVIVSFISGTGQVNGAL